MTWKNQVSRKGEKSRIRRAHTAPRFMDDAHYSCEGRLVDLVDDAWRAETLPIEGAAACPPARGAPGAGALTRAPGMGAAIPLPQGLAPASEEEQGEGAWPWPLPTHPAAPPRRGC